MGPDRPDDQNTPADQTPRPGNLQAETRPREQYYTELRITVSREQTAAARQITAEEQAASEKWQEQSTESRSMWSEHQRIWPPKDRPTPDRSEDPEGSWRIDRDRILKPADNSRVDAECDRIADLEKDRITPALRAVEAQDPDRHLAGFDHRLKGRDRIKEKVHGMINEAAFPPESAVSHVPDSIRFTFAYRESHYTEGVWRDIERLTDQGFQLQKRKNFWSDEEYKGINSQWIEPETGQRFEVQFHTRISYEAKQLTHPAYERLRTSPEDKFERMVLKAFQRKVTVDVPVPPGATDIPDYPR